MQRAPATVRRLACVLLLAVTLPAGIAWRLLPMGLPAFAFKYGGSALWAIAVYWTVAALLPRWRVLPLAGLAGLAAALVELFKMFRQPTIDAFRATLAGKLLLGRYFTLGAIVAYWVAIAAVALLDAHFRPGRRSSCREG